MNEVRLDPKKIPAHHLQNIARELLNFAQKHPELIDEYERETGKSFFINKPI